jgi:hypothetical protein
MSERCVGLERYDAEADPTESRGRLQRLGKRAKRAPDGSAGIMAMACVEEEDSSNTGNPVAWFMNNQPDAREG